MKLRSFKRFITEANQSLFRNPLMTVASIVTIALTLFICGVFSVIVLNINKFAGDIEDTVEIQAFIDTAYPDEDAAALMDSIKKVEGVDSVTFVSKENALADMAKQLGETSDDLLSSLGTNPLPDSYMVTALDAEAVGEIAVELEKMDGIADAKYGDETVDNLFTMLKWVRYFGIGLIIFLIIASIVIVAFNIKITVANRKEEISIMRYVGASNWYIRWPFCIAGMMMGLIGGIVAVALLYGAYSLFISQLGSALVFMKFIEVNLQFVYIFVLMLVFGLILGSAGSMISLNVYLKERKKK